MTNVFARELSGRIEAGENRANLPGLFFLRLLSVGDSGECFIKSSMFVFDFWAPHGIKAAVFAWKYVDCAFAMSCMEHDAQGVCSVHVRSACVLVGSSCSDDEKNQSHNTEEAHSVESFSYSTIADNTDSYTDCGVKSPAES